MHNTILCRTIFGGSVIFLLLFSYRTIASDRFEARIVDDRSSQLVAATLVVTDEAGKALEIEGKHGHVQYLGKRRCYVDGAFSLAFSPGRLMIELRRGLETLPLKAEVDLSQQRPAPLTFRLKRWIDMREQGYLSGDTHVHQLTQSESHLQMKAEDLHVLNLLVSDFTNDIEKFTGKLDPVSTPDHSVYVGQDHDAAQEAELFSHVAPILTDVILHSSGVPAGVVSTNLVVFGRLSRAE